MRDSLEAQIHLDAGGFSLDVAFEIPPGVTVLFGPSGAGKSRTLGCLAGITKPDTGRITLAGEVWFDSATGESLPIHARRVAYVFQSLALFPHMTASANVEYGLARTLSSSERRARADDILGRMRVRHLADRKPRTFSGGEAQRVALARAFAMTPKLLLLDEPFSALDTPTKKELLSEVAAWVERERIPTILVTHQPEEARALGHRVVFLAKGRIADAARIDDASF